MRSTALLMGAAFWCAAEIMEFIHSGFYAASNMAAAAGFAAISFGLSLLWDDEKADVTGRTGVALTVTGTGILAAFILFVLLTADIRSEADVAHHWAFILSSITIFTGIAALSVWIVRSRAYPAWVGYTFIAGTLCTFGAIFLLPQLTGLQIVANLVLAAALAEIAVINSVRLTESPRRAGEA